MDLNKDLSNSSSCVNWVTGQIHIELEMIIQNNLWLSWVDRVAGRVNQFMGWLVFFTCML